MPAEIAPEASDAKLTVEQAVMLCHFMSLPCCSSDVTLQMASQPDSAHVTAV